MGDYWGGRGDPHLVLSICLGRAKGERGEKKKKKKKPNIFFRPPLPNYVYFRTRSLCLTLI